MVISAEITFLITLYNHWRNYKMWKSTEQRWELLIKNVQTETRRLINGEDAKKRKKSLL